MKVLRGCEYDPTLDATHRFYLCGKLSVPQPVEHIPTDGLEIGISRYRSFMAEKPHLHSSNTEYNLVRSGEVKVWLPKEQKEYTLGAGDLFVIEPDMPYATKAVAGTEVLFVKSPGGNDKVLTGTDAALEAWAAAWNAPAPQAAKSSPASAAAPPETQAAAPAPAAKPKSGFKRLLGAAADAFRSSYRSIITAATTILALWGIVDGLYTGEEIIPAIGVWFGAVALIALAIYAVRFRRAWLGRITVKIRDKARITMLRDEFQNNMDYFLRTLPYDEQKKTVFVIGMDRLGSLEFISGRGIMHDLLPYLNGTFTAEDGLRPQDLMQRELNKKLADIGAPVGDPDDPSEPKYVRDPDYMKPLKSPACSKNLLPYATCVDVPMELVRKDNGERVSVNVLMIINSRLVDYTDPKLRNNVDDEGHGDIIVPAVYEYLCRRNYYTRAVIGVMGTNGTNRPYAVAFSETVTRFSGLFCSKEGRSPESVPVRDLVVSVREQDYAGKWGMNLSQLERYLRACDVFYEASAK